MATISVRNLDQATISDIKKAARQRAISMNRYIVETLEKSIGKNVHEHHDLDQFFGSWSQAEYARIAKSSKTHRKIDEELWK